MPILGEITDNSPQAARRRLRERGEVDKSELLKIFNVSIDEQIAHWSIPTLDGHRLWRSKAKGVPQINHRHKVLQVRPYVWSQFNKKEVPLGWIVFATCRYPNCIAGPCLKAMRRGEFLHSDSRKKKLTESIRLATGAGNVNDKYVSELIRISSDLLKHPRCNSIDDWKDLVQASVVSLWLSWAKHRKPIDNISKLLKRTIKNKMIDKYRARKNSFSLEEILGEGNEISPNLNNQAHLVLDYLSMPEELSPHSIYEVSQIAYKAGKLANSLLQKVPPRSRECFLLRYKYGYSQKEIAREMGISENTVEHHIQKAKKLAIPRESTSFNQVLL